MAAFRSNPMHTPGRRRNSCPCNGPARARFQRCAVVSSWIAVRGVEDRPRNSPSYYLGETLGPTLFFLLHSDHFAKMKSHCVHLGGRFPHAPSNKCHFFWPRQDSSAGSKVSGSMIHLGQLRFEMLGPEEGGFKVPSGPEMHGSCYAALGRGPVRKHPLSLSGGG